MLCSCPAEGLGSLKWDLQAGTQSTHGATIQGALQAVACDLRLHGALGGNTLCCRVSLLMLAGGVCNCIREAVSWHTCSALPTVGASRKRCSSCRQVFHSLIAAPLILLLAVSALCCWQVDVLNWTWCLLHSC